MSTDAARPALPWAARTGLSDVLRWSLRLALAWFLLSLALFTVSASLSTRPPADARMALSPTGNLLTGSTILLLGSEERWRPPRKGAGRASPSDSILLLHASLRGVRQMSVLRRSYATIPGHERGEIARAYAVGGPATAIPAVEGFLGNGLRVNHVAEVSFETLPPLVDALGGVEVRLDRCLDSHFDGRRFRLPRGESRLDGREALAFARSRANACVPKEREHARVLRQQQALSAIGERLRSPATLLRLPWVSWHGPRAVRTDMGPMDQLALLVDIVAGGSSEPRVLSPYSDHGPGHAPLVSRSERRRGVRDLLGR
jgi:LCP family protein required for cell wall assembly